MTLIRRAWLVLLVLAIFILTLPVISAQQPLLYTLKNASISDNQEDLAVTGDLQAWTDDKAPTDEALVLSEWATSLNLTGKLVQDIKKSNFESANHSEQKYLQSGQSLNGLIVQLDLGDTDITTFNQDNLANIQSLQQLLNQTGEFTQLQSLQVQYQESGDTAMLASVKVMDEELLKKVRKNYQGYASRERQVVNISQKYGLITSSYEQSVLDFAAIVVALETVQDGDASPVPVTIPDQQNDDIPAITFQVVPDHGVYGDLLSMAGSVMGPAGTEVTIFLDGKPLTGVIAGEGGQFDFPYRVGLIEAGQHTANASAGVALSNEYPFTITRVNTMLTLNSSLVEVNGIINAVCTGNLTSVDGRPIIDASIQILVDGNPAAQATTDGNGSYRMTVQNLTQNSHIIEARFNMGNSAQNKSFSLNGSKSAPLNVEAPSIIRLLAPFLYILGIGDAAVIAFLYLRRRRKIEAVYSDLSEEPLDPVVDLPATALTEEEATEAATLLVAGVTGHDAIINIYRKMVGDLDAQNPNYHILSETPRELALRFAAEPYGGRLIDLVEIYEQVLYAGLQPTEEDISRMRDGFIYVTTRGVLRGEGPSTSRVTPVTVTESLRDTAKKLAAGELREGIGAVYDEFLIRLGQQQPCARFKVRTPKEIRDQFKGTSIATSITAITEIYEAIVYSGRTPVEKDRSEMIDLFVVIFSELERANR